MMMMKSPRALPGLADGVKHTYKRPDQTRPDQTNYCFARIYQEHSADLAVMLGPPDTPALTAGCHSKKIIRIVLISLTTVRGPLTMMSLTCDSVTVESGRIHQN